MRLWRDYGKPGAAPKPVTAWCACPEIIPTPRRTASGIHMEWLRSRRLLAFAGDSRIIRLWDVESELNTQVSGREHGDSYGDLLMP